ncbi:MAG: glycosyltransferase family 2 protein [Candidatus Omnitrophica bacterium]|nr:glycosyltransferase family 2 protein [Candidatus Omnitrophota bacterium]
MKKICILIPTFNEAKTIGQIIRDLKRLSLAAYVVDDGSADESASISEREGAVVMRHPRNMGKGAALRTGFERILRDGFDAVLVMDGDGQHTIEDVERFIKEEEYIGADMIIGNRMLETSAMPRHRVVTNKFMSGVISRLSGQYVPDTQCGFRLIKREVLQKVKLESSNYEIESEMILLAARERFTIESLPIKTVYRDEKSRINPLVDTLRFIMLMAKILCRR